MLAAVVTGSSRLILLAQEHAEEVSEPKDLYPHATELIVSAIGFIIVFVFMAKFVVPRLNTVLDERRQRIQGEMERAEKTREEADGILEQYRQQLANAREEANRVIEEARQTAEGLRKELSEKAERDSEAIVARAQDEIRAERDRAFADLKAQVGELSVELATRVVGESLDRERQLRLVDQYIDDLTRQGGAGGGATGGDDGGAGGGS
ncbi:MAG: F0F1 ATP synthase subunit B [Actinobacteria bacterium]|nr:F0F1 ATP synthase subunit B [Actinomycetota bacterium]